MRRDRSFAVWISARSDRIPRWQRPTLPVVLSRGASLLPSIRETSRGIRPSCQEVTSDSVHGSSVAAGQSRRQGPLSNPCSNLDQLSSPCPLPRLGVCVCDPPPADSHRSEHSHGSHCLTQRLGRTLSAVISCPHRHHPSDDHSKGLERLRSEVAAVQAQYSSRPQSKIRTAR